jgi:PAS domain S-box-containing protein
MNKTCTLQKALILNSTSAENKLLEKAFRRCCPKTEVIKGRSLKTAVDRLQRDMIDAVFIDYPYSREDFDFFDEVQRNDIIVHIVALINKGDELNAAEALKDGAYDYLIKDSDYSESLPRVIGRIRSLSKLKREKEEELKQRSLLFKQIFASQKWWQNIIDSMTDYLFVIDLDFRILRTNKAFSGLFGKEPADIIMKPYYKLFGLKEPHEWCILPEAGNEQSLNPDSIEYKINGVDYLISYFPIFFDEHEAVVYILKDITENRRLKDQIYHMDKLSSLGTLTSGVAHEINNPLTGIIGYTEMLLMNEDDSINNYLQKIFDSAIRCKRIVENMLTFSRQTPSQKSPEEINTIIDKTVELHEYWLRSTNVEVVKNYEKVPFIFIDRQQIQQVILNLLINAEQAISESGRKGRIEFITRYDRQSDHILITVSDNGNGIPADILPKIFDPFFTTKPVNKGTGLGLSIAHGIILEQGGTIEAASIPGEGTSFVVKFPVKINAD